MESGGKGRGKLAEGMGDKGREDLIGEKGMGMR